MNSRLIQAILLLASLGNATAQDASLSRRDAALPSALSLGITPGERAIQAGTSPGASSVVAGPDQYGEQEILARPNLWQPWTISTSFGGDWQSNGALSPTRTEPDYVLRHSASARYTRKLTESWYLDLGAAEQLVRYDEFDVLDYDRIDGDAGVLWITPPEWAPVFRNWVISTRASYYRLSEADHFSTELFANTAVSGTLIRSFSLHRHHSLLFSLSGEVSTAATEDEVKRNEYAALLAWQAQWSPRWETTLLARGAFFDYERHDDVNLIGSLSIDYIFHKNLRLGLAGSWTQNLSNEPSFEYGNASAGASLRLQLRF